MTFVQPEFLAFLAVVLPLYWALPHRLQNWFLIGASVVFYGWVHPWFVSLMLISAVTDYVCAVQIRSRPTQARAWMVVSVLSAVALLGTFKYFDFFVSNVDAALSTVGLSPGLPVLGLALPAGISFYTFQTLSYTIDVYKGALEPRRNFVDYLLFVTFFPQLVAGPIERADALLPQVERPRRFTVEAFRTGLTLLAWGAIKKIVVADSVSPYVDHLFSLPERSLLVATAGGFGFMVQILTDFSSYTDLARGTAKLLGFELTQNFKHPLMARNPPNLWERWHISFSSWLRDYIYLPVSNSAGFRRWLRVPGLRETGLTNQIRATLVTMAFSGLWHGAAWHFVAWGLYWGLLQVAWLVLERRSAFVRRHKNHWVNIGWMFPLQLFADILFREPEMERFFGWAAHPLTVNAGEPTFAAATFAVTVFGGGILVAGLAVDTWLVPRLTRSAARPVAEAAFWTLAVVAVGIFARSTQSDFVYFAF